MNDSLKKIDLSDLLASSVHDMKNSLSILLDHIRELTEKQKSKDDEVDDLAQMEYEAKRLNNDLMQLLTLYRMGNSQYLLDISYHCLHDFIEEQIIFHQSLFEQKGIKVTIDCSEDLCWFFDEGLISSIFNNVLNNLVRYTEDKIKILIEIENDYLVISIEDNGMGYPEKMIKSVGTPKETVDFKTGSTGLGLYFAAMVARVHRKEDREGEIVLQNGGEYDGGCFKLYLP